MSEIFKTNQFNLICIENSEERSKYFLVNLKSIVYLLKSGTGTVFIYFKLHPMSSRLHNYCPWLRETSKIAS